MLLLLLLTHLGGCSDQPVAPGKGEAAPGFVLQDLQGRSVQFPAEFTERVVLLNFWADWCPSCRREMRGFETLYQKYEHSGLQVVAVNVKQDGGVAQAFIEDLNLSYSVLLDSNGATAQDYAIYSLPAALIIDRQGRLHTRILGEADVGIFEQIIVSLL